MNLDGAKITHNHPPEYGEMVSFGKDEFALYQANMGTSQLMACNPNYNYYLSVKKSLGDVDLSLSDDCIKFIVGVSGNDENRQEIIEYIEGRIKEGMTIREWLF